MHSLNAAAPSSTTYDLSSRTKTSAYVDWTPEASTQTHVLLYTPDISDILTEIVGQTGWTSGSPMAFLIEWVSGTGSRWVESTYTSSEYASLTGGAGVVPALEVLGVLPPPPPPDLNWPTWSVTSRANNAEENAQTGSMYLTSSDLELPFDGSTQQVIGIVFSSVDVDTTSTIANSHLGTIAATLESQD